MLVLKFDCRIKGTISHPHHFISSAVAMETSSDSQYEYNMNHKKRGLFVIINNRDFHKKTGMNGRNGTDVDAANLYQRFKELGFEVHIFHNKTIVEMSKIMLEGTVIIVYNYCIFLNPGRIEPRSTYPSKLKSFKSFLSLDFNPLLISTQVITDHEIN